MPQRGRKITDEKFNAVMPEFPEFVENLFRIFRLEQRFCLWNVYCKCEFWPHGFSFGKKQLPRMAIGDTETNRVITATCGTPVEYPFVNRVGRLNNWK
jgi:hypothetical protein